MAGFLVDVHSHDGADVSILRLISLRSSPCGTLSKATGFLHIHFVKVFYRYFHCCMFFMSIIQKSSVVVGFHPSFSLLGIRASSPSLGLSKTLVSSHPRFLASPYKQALLLSAYRKRSIRRTCGSYYNDKMLFSKRFKSIHGIAFTVQRYDFSPTRRFHKLRQMFHILRFLISNIHTPKSLLLLLPFCSRTAHLLRDSKVTIQ